MMTTHRLLASLTLGAALLLTGACNRDDDMAGHGCGVEGASAVCGKICNNDGDCGIGAYCTDEKQCTADCLQGGSECGEGKICDGRGKCADLENACIGLKCKVNLACAGGAHTTLTGKVYAPNGTLPLYNAAVFVPNAALSPLTAGVTCDRCDGTLSGDPIAKALTGPDGTFTLVDVPTGTDIPLVVQMGKWRRQVKITSVPDCTTTAINDAALTRLPKNASEGDIPHMAIATGDADPLECLFIKLGLDPNEITLPSGSGRIHFFRATDRPGLNMTMNAPRAETLYSSLNNLLNYDVVLLPCEGGPFDKSRLNNMPLNPNPRDLLVQYLDMGGRVFATHYSYDWLTYPMSPYNKVAMTKDMNGLWPTEQRDDYNNTIHTTLVTNFPKGLDFSKWLVAAGATSMPGQLDIKEGRSDLIDVDPNFAQAWSTYDFTPAPIMGRPAVMHTTFNTPIDAPKDAMGVGEYCGRVVYSDFHATAGAITKKTDPYPMACKSDPMTDQEKTLAFMLFDLSSCVQDDQIAPVL